MREPPSLRSALAGDRAALEELAGYCFPAVFSYLQRLCFSRELATDLAQDTMVCMLESLHTYRPRPGAGFMSWVFRVAHNRFIDDMRRREYPLADGDGAKDMEGADSTSAAALSSLDTEELCKALGQLSPTDRELIKLRYWFGFSHREAAEILGVKPPIVKSRLNAALVRLRKQYAIAEKGNGNAKVIIDSQGD